ncbi:hypothetical protein DL96DRAFT_1622943, partial [Flagelloscypha sp. PMI_526]
TLASAIFKSSTPFMHLPLEILQHIVFFINEHLTLKAVSLTSTALVYSAQAKMFSRLNLSRSPPDIIQYLTSSPHILWHIRSIIACQEDPELPTILGALAHSRRLVDLTFVSDGSHIPWPTPLLRVLLGKTLPFLLSLTLDQIDAPLFLVASCTSLQRLRAYASTLYAEGEEGFSTLFNMEENPLQHLGIISSSLESKSMPFLTMLALDGTRNDDPRMCPLVEAVPQEIFPALKCLDLSRNDANWFPLEDIARVTKPLMNQLVCLDIGHWPQLGNECAEEDYRQSLDLFQIHHYPHLLFFSALLQQKRHQDRNVEYNQLVCHIEWLLDMFGKLASPHPLKILRLQLAAEWGDGDGVDGYEGEHRLSGGIWKRFDSILMENRYLERFEKVTIPILQKFRTMRWVLGDSLPMLSATGRLSFELTGIEDYFASWDSHNTIS